MSRDKPVFVLIAGPNGAGKTSITGSLRDHSWLDECTYLNPDEVAQTQFNGWNDPESVRKAAQYCVEYRDAAIRRGESLALETVFSSDDKVDALKRAKRSGFFTRVFFIGTNTPEINAARITRRVMEGGHSVPIDKIISRYQRSMVCCEIAIYLAHRVYLYDNSGAWPEAQLRTRNGKIAKIYVKPMQPWATEIQESITHHKTHIAEQDDEDEDRLKL